MGKFILIVFVVYVIYYTVNIIYDGFLKKTNVVEDNDDEEIVVDGDETPQNITVDDIGYNDNQTVVEPISGKAMELSAEETNIINGVVEDQGIPVDGFLSEINSQLLGESKQMFAGVNF